MEFPLPGTSLLGDLANRGPLAADDGSDHVSHDEDAEGEVVLAGTGATGAGRAAHHPAGHHPPSAGVTAAAGPVVVLGAAALQLALLGGVVASVW